MWPTNDSADVPLLDWWLTVYSMLSLEEGA